MKDVRAKVSVAPRAVGSLNFAFLGQGTFPSSQRRGMLRVTKLSHYPFTSERVLHRKLQNPGTQRTLVSNHTKLARSEPVIDSSGQEAIRYIEHFHSEFHALFLSRPKYAR